MLVQIVRKELQQREMLNARFAGREQTSLPAEAFFPAEND
jgi:hypothetical protein